MRSLSLVCLFVLSIITGVFASPVPAVAATKGGEPAANNGTSSAGTAQSSGSTATFESQMLAYGGIQHISKKIAQTVCGSNGVDSTNSAIVIYDQGTFANLQAYGAFITNLEIISSAYEALVPGREIRATLRNIWRDRMKSFDEIIADPNASPEEKLTALRKLKIYASSAAGSSDAFSEAQSLISSLVTATNSESSGQITIPDTAMTSALVHEIQGQCKNKVAIIYPPLFGMNPFAEYASTDIEVQIQKLNDVRAVAQGMFLTTQDSKNPPPNPVTSQSLTDVNGLYDTFMNALLQANSSTGVMGSASIIMGDQLATILRGTQCSDEQKDETGHCPTPSSQTEDPYATWTQRPAYILLASVVNAGGTEKDHKNVLTSLWTGDKITYSGGAIVNVSLWQANSGAPLYSNVLRYRAPFSSVKKPSDSSGDTDGDNLKQ